MEKTRQSILLIVPTIFLLVLVLTVPVYADYLPTQKQLDRAIELLKKIGTIDEVSGPTLKAGKEGELGKHAFFVPYAPPFAAPLWCLEERIKLQNGDIKLTRWIFVDLLAHKIEYIFKGETNQIISDSKREFIIKDKKTDPEVIAKSEETWRMLLQAGKPI